MGRFAVWITRDQRQIIWLLPFYFLFYSYFIICIVYCYFYYLYCLLLQSICGCHTEIWPLLYLRCESGVALFCMVQEAFGGFSRSRMYYLLFPTVDVLYSTTLDSIEQNLVYEWMSCAGEDCGAVPQTQAYTNSLDDDEMFDTQNSTLRVNSDSSDFYN